MPFNPRPQCLESLHIHHSFTCDDTHSFTASIPNLIAANRLNPVMDRRLTEGVSHQSPEQLANNGTLKEQEAEPLTEESLSSDSSEESLSIEEVVEGDLVPMRITKRAPFPSYHGFYTDVMLGTAAMNPDRSVCTQTEMESEP